MPPSMPYDFFVSYSTRDKAFVDALAHRLEERGYRCWYAPRDIEPGMSWPAAIARALQESKLMLLVFSSSANDSEEIARELTLASGNRLPVIPVRIENVLPCAELAYHLSNRHWLDVYDLELEAAISRVEEGLERYFEVQAGRSGQEEPEGQAGPADAGGWSKNFAAPTLPPKKRLPLKAPLLLILLLLAAGAFSWLFYFKEAPPPWPDDPTARLMEPSEKSGVYFYESRQGGSVTAFVLPLAPLPIPDLPYVPPPDEFLVGFADTGGVYDGRIFRCRRDFGQAMRFITEIKGNNQMIFSVDSQTLGMIFDPQSKREFPVKGVRFTRDRETAMELIGLYRDKQKWRGYR